MFSFIHEYSFFFILLSNAFIYQFITTLPVSNSNRYKLFIDSLIDQKCRMPKEVDVPFPSNDSSPFSFLSSPLEECQTPDASTKNDEANFLCSEIFEIIHNITCSKDSVQLPKISSNMSFEDICNDFKSLKDVFPKGENYLSGKLVDNTLCQILCTKGKYETLCKTLLWSHDIQAKIKGALEKDSKENKEISEQKSSHKTEGNIDNNKIEDSQNMAGLNNIESSTTNTSFVPSKTTLSKTDNSVSNAQNGTDLKSTNVPEDTKIPSSSKTLSTSANEITVQPTNLKKETTSNDVSQLVESNQDLQVKGNGSTHNDMNVQTKSTNSELEIPAADDNKLISKNVVIDSSKNISINSPEIEEKHLPNVSSYSSTEENNNSNNFVSPDNKMDNELNNVNIEEEKETKVKESDLKISDKDEMANKPKLTDFESPIGSPDIELKQLESTTLILPPGKDEEVEHQEDKEQDQYNDTENEDYPKSEYDNSFSPPLKNTEIKEESNAKSSIIEVSSNQMSNNYDTFISSRNSIVGHLPDDMPVIQAFPEQEDSHFFFYFLSIVLILMTGYLIFHNKQKIIALIVEGRHERRRRSHGAGYKKLETK